MLLYIKRNIRYVAVIPNVIDPNPPGPGTFLARSDPDTDLTFLQENMYNFCKIFIQNGLINLGLHIFLGILKMLKSLAEVPFCTL
jgi:hypothetical protein